MFVCCRLIESLLSGDPLEAGNPTLTSRSSRLTQTSVSGNCRAFGVLIWHPSAAQVEDQARPTLGHSPGREHLIKRKCLHFGARQLCRPMLQASLCPPFCFFSMASWSTATRVKCLGHAGVLALLPGCLPIMEHVRGHDDVASSLHLVRTHVHSLGPVVACVNELHCVLCVDSSTNLGPKKQAAGFEGSSV